MTIKDAFATVHRKTMQPSTKADQKHGEALLVNWVGKSLRPFVIIEDEGFVKYTEWLNQLRTTFKLPSRHKLKQQLVQVSHLVEKKIVEEINKNVEFFCMTTDIWSSRVMESYMAETLHYVTEAFDMRTLTLEVTPLRGAHTGDNIKKFWEESFMKYGLNKEKLSIMLRDNAPNGIKACRDWGIKSFGCIGHSIHLVVGPFLVEKKESRSSSVPNEEDEIDDVAEYEIEEDCSVDDKVKEVRKLVSRVRKIVKFIKNSPKAKEKITSYLGSKGEKMIMVTLDVRTRWNSAYDMILKFLSLKDAIDQFLVFLSTSSGRREFPARRFDFIIEEEWALLSGLCVLLEPFKEVTENLSGDTYPTFAHALPLLRGIHNFLEDDTLFDATLNDEVARTRLLSYRHNENFSSVLEQLRGCQQIILESYMKRFRGMDRSVLWISYLDPRLRKMKHLNNVERNIAQADVVMETVRLAEESAEKNIIKIENEDEDPTKIMKKRSRFSTIYDSPQRQGQNTTGNDATIEGKSEARTIELIRAAQLELANYLSLPTSTQDPLYWWKKNSHLFPMLACTARKWLCINATSTASERVFLGCGLALSAKRSSMNGSPLKSQIMIRQNMKGLNITVDDLMNAI